MVRSVKTWSGIVPPPALEDIFGGDSGDWMVNASLPWKLYQGIRRAQQRRPDLVLPEVLDKLVADGWRFYQYWMTECEMGFYNIHTESFRLVRAMGPRKKIIRREAPTFEGWTPLWLWLRRRKLEPWVTEVHRRYLRCQLQMSAQSGERFSAAALYFGDDRDNEPLRKSRALKWLLGRGIWQDDLAVEGWQLRVRRQETPWQLPMPLE
jgi:hypothetical protein